MVCNLLEIDSNGLDGLLTAMLQLAAVMCEMYGQVRQGIMSTDLQKLNCPAWVGDA